MTGYLARLAARTGIGDNVRFASPATIPPPETEEVVTFVTQSEGSATPSAPDSGAAPLVASAAVPAARFKILDTPGAARAAEPAPGPLPANRGGDGVAAPVDRLPAGGPLPTQETFAISERPQANTPDAREAETRMATPAIAGPAAPAAVLTRAVDPTARAPFRPAPIGDPAKAAPVSEPPRLEHVFETAADAPWSASRAPGALAEQHSRFSPREPSPPQPARAASRPEAGPSVRIGSIQLDVHAAPPKPALGPTLPRAPSLRRFYLRDW